MSSVSSPQDSTVIQRHLRRLTILSLSSRVLVAALVVSSTYLLTLFDSSPRLVLPNTTPWISSLLRWDAFHFVHIARAGHAYEHEWAFFPALPFLMRVSGTLLSHLGLNSNDWSAPLLGSAILAALFDSTHVLYHLTLHHLHSPSAAFLTAALSLLSSSPATLRFTSYNEPFFTYASYRGMLACARSQWVRASIWFAVASGFRSNGIFSCGFLIWGMLVSPYLSARKDMLTPARVCLCTVLVALPLAPFVYHNYQGYILFCTSSPTSDRAAWCHQGWVPLIYSHVQRKYWNIGFLRYWTLSNVPNFILALPILCNICAFCAFYLSWMGDVFPALSGPLSSRAKQAVGRASERATTTSADGARSPPSLFLRPSLFPHVLHALSLVFLLTFTAHVQIALRVLPSLPLTYWAAARLLIECDLGRGWGWGKMWIGWSVVWGMVSCVCWGVFLPPA